jgi:phosphoglycerate dehydrogenase-like enzyme
MTEPPIRVVVAGPPMPDFRSAGLADDVEATVAHTDEALISAVRRAEVLFAWTVPDIIPDQTPGLRWVQLPSAGIDHIRHLPVWESSIIITASKGIHTVPMSEHVFALLLALVRRVPDFVLAQQRHEWLPLGLQLRVGELRGKTMGIIGWGKIGDGVAHLARAFGMRVIGTRWSVLVPREMEGSDARPFEDPPWLEPVDLPPDIVYPAAEMHDVLAQSDVVVLIVPLTDDTAGSFGQGEFRTMKRGSLFINIGRGRVVDEAALVRALRAGQVGGAGLDVVSREPLPRSSPLWSLPNVIISPHVGGVSDHTLERASWFFTVNLTRYLSGEQLLNVVDREKGY